MNDVLERSALSEALEPARGLRVALFSGNYNYVKDGANQALNRLVGHLIDRGAAVRVYSPTTATPAFEPVGDLVSVPSFSIPWRREFRIAPGLGSAAGDDLERFSPNLVHLSAPDWLGTAAQRWARERRLPIVASFHTRFETYFEYYGLRLLRGWAWRRQRDYYRQSDLVLAPNLGGIDHLAGMGVPRDRIRLWGRGVDSSLFTPERRSDAWRRAHGYDDGEIVLCFFGRLVREKGIGMFAETVDILRGRGHRVRPLVIGGGPAEAEFRGLAGDACFTGHLQGEALGEAVASADILLNPSVTEAFGNVNLEAMAAGLAVVSADTPSAAALIDDGVNGLLAKPVAQSLANRVEALLADADLLERLRRNAVESAGRWSWTRASDQALAAYLELRTTR